MQSGGEQNCLVSRAEKTRAASISNKSAITDHVCNKNHVIDWDGGKVINPESDNTVRLIREALTVKTPMKSVDF